VARVANAPGPRTRQRPLSPVAPFILRQLQRSPRGSLLTRLEPFEKLLDELEQLLRTQQLSAPTSDLAAVIAVVVTQLKAAIQQSRHTEALATIQEIAHAYGRAPSTVTDWAHNYGAEWARKRGRVWLIDTALFEAWYAANEARLKNRARKSVAVAGEVWADAA